MNKKVNLNLVGLDGNAFALLGAFSAQARKEGWSQAEIAEVRKKCMSGDYNNLLCVLMDHCESNDEEDESYDDEEDESYDEEDDNR